MDKRNSIIIIIVIILLLAGGVWFGTQKVKKEQEAMKITEVRNKEIISENSDNKKVDEKLKEDIDTSDWQIYRNEEMGFEVKMPKNWIVDIDKDKLHIYSKINRDDMPEGGGAIVVEIKKINLQEFIEEYEANDPPHTKISKQEKFIFNGNLSTKLIASTAIGIDRSIILLEKDKSFIISFHEFDRYHIEIISTFRFI